MRLARRINVGWATPPEGAFTWDHVAVEVLMDLRDELQRLNALLHCKNFVAIPRKLDAIAANTREPKRKPKRKVKR
jgi:hypothetical protein